MLNAIRRATHQVRARIPFYMTMPSATLWAMWWLAVANVHAAALTGTVRTAAGTALGNVDIDAIDACSGASLFLASDHTAADGTFSVSVPNGTYDLHFVPPAGSSWSAGDRQDLIVNGNAALGVVTLKAGALVSGTVRDPLGVAAANVDLKFVDSVAGARVFLTKTVTDALGHWSVRVPPGTWDLDFRPALGSAWRDAERTGLIVGTADIPGLLDVLRTGVSWTGIVRDKNGAAVANADLSAFDQCTGDRVATAHDNTDAAGAFSIVVPPGQYTITVDPPACRGVEATRVVDRVVTTTTDLGVLTLRPAGLVSGVVRDPAGAPVAGAKLRVFDNARTGAPRQGTTDDRTALTGAFAVRVPSGTYDIHVDPPAGRALQVLRFSNVAVNNDLNLGTIVMVAGLPISGHVQPPPGIPAQNVNINVLDHTTRASLRLAHDATDVAGNFTVVVPTGTYDVQFDPPVCSGLSPSSFDSVVVSVPFVLPSLPMSVAIHLRGRVLDGAGSGVPALDLDVFPAGSAHKLYTPGAITAIDGSFDILEQPGRYDIEYLPALGSRLRPSRISYGPASTSVSLPTVVLAAGRLLSGRILAAGSLQPVVGAHVQLFLAGSSTAAWVLHSATDATGRYSFPVDSARYDVRFEPPSGAAFTTNWLPGVLVGADLILPDQVLNPISTGLGPARTSSLTLAAAFPNPASAHARWSFQGAHGHTELTLWDIQGRRVALLWNGVAEGLTTVEWDRRDAAGKRVAPGLYLARLRDDTGATRVGRVWVME